MMPGMIRPLRAGEAFLADVQAAGGPLDLWWLGQSGFLVAHDGRHLLLDPYLSDSLTRKYADTDKPHVRMTELVIEPGRLGFVDVVTASHAHTDHLDPDTLRALDAELVAPEAHRELAAERAGRAADGHRRRPDRRDRRLLDHRRPGRPRGDRARRARAGCCTSATSCAAARSRSTTRATRSPTRAWRSASGGGIDVALLPINGRAPERRVAGNLNGEEAAALAHEIGARLAVPMHFEMFEFNTEPPDAFVAACERLGQPYRVLRAGERLTLP